MVRRKDYATSEEFDAALLETLRAHKIDLVVLAGFLSVLGPSVIAAYPRRILNVHPALIPSFCGPGMYGLRPHEAALARGCKVTGATVHFVNEECDGGPILLQKMCIRDRSGRAAGYRADAQRHPGGNRGAERCQERRMACLLYTSWPSTMPPCPTARLLIPRWS